MEVEFSQDVLDDMAHEDAVHEEFGPYIGHVCNFNMDEVTKITEVCDKLDSTFVGVAFVDGGHTSSGLIGVYTSDMYERELFWRMYDSASLANTEIT